ncbi:MAG TPA: ABC transporter permease subunit [Spirochaetota bacterium]|nr:ABC transporter permease subunit [Spirochaetota bacterium]
MRKSKRTWLDIVKEILSHIMLIFVALIVLMPILYLVAAGFRTNQAIFGPFIDFNSWIDRAIADKSANKISKIKVLNRITMAFDGKTEDEIKEYEKSNKKIIPSLESKESDIREIKAKAKEWVYRNGKGNTYNAYLEAIKKWENKKKEPYNNLKKDIESLNKEKATLEEKLAAVKRPIEKASIEKSISDIEDKIRNKEEEMSKIEEEVSSVMSQLFEDYSIEANTYKSRYVYDVRTSLYNFACFFTGEVPNAKDAKFPYLKWFINSIIIAGAVALIQLSVTALAGYALSRFRFAGKKVGLMIILTVQVFPGTMAMVALYLLLQYLGNIVPALGIDRKLGLILIYLGGGIPFNMWLVKGYFDTIPKALEESAMIDGATYWQAFITIILPLVRPILAVITILSFVGIYNEFVLAMVVLTSQDNYTLPLGLRFFMSGQQESRFGVFAACSVLGSLPIVVLWLSLQNQIISGLTGGAVKG